MKGSGAMDRARVKGPLRMFVVGAVCAVFLLPLYWAVVTSLRETGRPLPRHHRMVAVAGGMGQLSNCVSSWWTRIGLPSTRCSSRGVAVPATIVFASLAGFAMSQLPHRYRTRLVAVSAICLMVPLTAIWIPRFLLFKEAGLMNRREALMVPSVMGTSPFFALLFLWAFLSVPREIYDAAKLDGAGVYRIWAGIGLPQVKAAIGTVAVLAFVHYWNSFRGAFAADAHA